MHKLAFRWTSFSIDYASKPPRFAAATAHQDAVMDLTKLQDNGILTGGTFEDGHGHSFSINGKVTEIGGRVTLLEIFRDDGLAHFEGLLVRDHKGEMTIAGRRLTPTAIRGRKKIFEQVEDPWVITKP